jgi:hypothetical protein
MFARCQIKSSKKYGYSFNDAGRSEEGSSKDGSYNRGDRTGDEAFQAWSYIILRQAGTLITCSLAHRLLGKGMCTLWHGFVWNQRMKD